MKFSKFVIECNKNYIDPNIAIENENIIKALKERNDKKVIDILHNDF
tara:strand:- start:63 stop:203 length:141 start_codon:yes stop_codon:yes gene_type:complete